MVNFSVLKPHKIQPNWYGNNTLIASNLHAMEGKTVVGILTRWPDLKWTASYCAMSTINPESLSPGRKNDCCSWGALIYCRIDSWKSGSEIIVLFPLDVVSWGWKSVEIMMGMCLCSMCFWYHRIWYPIQTLHIQSNKSFILKRSTQLERINICQVLKSIFEVNGNEFHQFTHVQFLWLLLA